MDLKVQVNEFRQMWPTFVHVTNQPNKVQNILTIPESSTEPSSRQFDPQ